MSHLETPSALRRWCWAIAAVMLLLSGCALRGAGTDGQTPGSQLDNAAPGLDRCEKKGSTLCADTSDAAEALLALSTRSRITVADICPRPGSSSTDGRTPGSQIDNRPIAQRLASGIDVMNETLARTQCVQACGGTPDCCECCAQPTRDPASLTALCSRTLPRR
jgi:predicted small secreted protein